MSQCSNPVQVNRSKALLEQHDECLVIQVHRIGHCHNRTDILISGRGEPKWWTRHDPVRGVPRCWCGRSFNQRRMYGSNRRDSGGLSSRNRWTIVDCWVGLVDDGDSAGRVGWDSGRGWMAFEALTVASLDWRVWTLRVSNSTLVFNFFFSFQHSKFNKSASALYWEMQWTTPGHDHHSLDLHTFVP